MRKAARYCGILFLSLLATEATAYDMSGRWLVSGAEIPFRLDLLQSSGALSSSAPWWAAIPWSGTIDEGNGAFHLEASVIGCGMLTFDGAVASDGRTFAGTVTYPTSPWDGCSSQEECLPVPFEVIGSRCGNGQVDPGEECDFGDAVDGDCCSSACLLSAAGDSCTPDANQCTSDLCSAAGVCEHEPASGSCEEPNGCGTGTCVSGACQITAPTPAGTPCDPDDSVCTRDACDGAGACAKVEDVECWPCGTCDPHEGCILGAWHCYGTVACSGSDADSLKLKLRTSEHDRRRRFQLNFSEEFGELLTGGGLIQHAICVYAQDGDVVRTVLNAEVPNGATCDGDPCWNGRKYRDKAGTAGGMTSIDVSWDRIKVRGAGPNLVLPDTLPMTSTFLARLITWEPGDFYNRRCWSHSVSAVRQTTEFFHGEYRATRGRSGTESHEGEPSRSLR